VAGVTGISAFLEQHHGVQIVPGGKGLCPFCRRSTFAVRKDDSLGKCFHASCGRFISEGSLASSYAGSLYQILDAIKRDCHEHLLRQRKPGNGYGYEFLVQGRQIHADVVRDLGELGAVPPGYDLAAVFRPAFEALQTREAELKAKLEESLARRLESKEQRQQDHAQGNQKAKPTAKGKTEQEKAWENDLQRLQEQRLFLEEQAGTLRERLGSTAGWLAFFHTDQFHRVRSIRFRKPFEKRFQSYQPFKTTGLFGHALFKLYQGEQKQEQNRLVLVEGEVNLLQIHSLAIRTARGDAGGSWYANWVGAVGSANTVDLDTIQALLRLPGAVRRPVVIQDHDDAGDAMVKSLAEKCTVEVVIPPTRGQDIDDLIRSFGKDYRKALLELQRLLAGRQLVCRPFEAVARQIYEIRQKHGKEDQRREFEVHNQVQAVAFV
jgi:hypothetical protein